MHWLGPTPAIRVERHYGDRLMRCFGDRPENTNVMLAEAVAARPGGEALVCGADRLTYRHLNERVGHLATGLSLRGIGVGDRAALLLNNSSEFVITLLAVLRLGAIAVPLNVREGPRELAYVLGDSGAKLVVHHETLASSLPPSHETPSLIHRLAIDGTRGVESLAPYLGTTSPPATPIDEEATAAILYTSGTTGRPKGAMITHLSLVHAAMIYEACMGLGPDDCSVAAVPLTHVTGLTANIAAMLRAKAKLVVMPAFKASTFLELATAERMTQTVMVPAMYNLCLLNSAFAKADLSAWRIGGYGGAPMPSVAIEQLARDLPGLKLMNAYGSTETTGPVVLMPPSEAGARARAVGCAVPVADALVMDDDGREAAPGETGEIWLKSPNVVPGYWNNPAATAEGFVEGFWRSGDLGTKDADGFVTLLDRAKDMLNRGGFKIYSVEVENVLAAYSGVAEAAVVARPCPVLGERVHAFVVARDGASLDAAALRRFAADNLADYKVPETLTILDQPLPRNAGGKVLKRELRDRLTAVQSTSSPT